MSAYPKTRFFADQLRQSELGRIDPRYVDVLRRLKHVQQTPTAWKAPALEVPLQPSADSRKLVRAYNMIKRLQADPRVAVYMIWPPEGAAHRVRLSKHLTPYALVNKKAGAADSRADILCYRQHFADKTCADALIDWVTTLIVVFSDNMAISVNSDGTLYYSSHDVAMMKRDGQETSTEERRADYAHAARVRFNLKKEFRGLAHYEKILREDFDERVRLKRKATDCGGESRGKKRASLPTSSKEHVAASSSVAE